MIAVAEALENLFALVSPLDTETVPLRSAAGRVLSRSVAAGRDQPPFPASAMDGYAVKAAEVEPDALFKVVGEAAAGHAWAGTLKAGQAVRIFTGAPVPAGADRVVIQEDVSRTGDLITLGRNLSEGSNIRPAGVDFAKGSTFDGPRRLFPADIALLAAMNVADVPVARAPRVALISTGDELVMPGGAPGPDQIIASNTFGLAAQITERGGRPSILPIAGDTEAALRQAFALARGADLILTIGGASVGDHDLVAPVTAELGMVQSFYKVAMRPGKPLMAGTLDGTPMIGLPGNPVSAMVCGTVFVGPVLDALQGLPACPAPRRTAPLIAALSANGPREHYMRATLGPEGVRDAGAQDSSLLHVLAHANALIVRPPGDPARAAGDTVEIIDL
ncbi:MAG: gephyrin-like molybdotransferase Glp [Pseudomonadota bacterium]